MSSFSIYSKNGQLNMHIILLDTVNVGVGLVTRAAQSVGLVRCVLES